MKRVVWVDDDPLLNRPLRQELELRHLELIFLESCAEFLDYIDSGTPADIFIVDLVMRPEGRVSNLASNYGLETGIPLVFETRRIHPKTPIVVFTNTANIAAREEAKRKLAGMDGVLLVPKSRMTQSGRFSELVTSLLGQEEAPSAANINGQDDGTISHDVFISYASQDRESIAQPLALELRERGLRVWFDESVLALGDSLHESIDRGLSGSNFGVVILSPAFLAKRWPMRELGALVAKEVLVGKVILPIWHGITKQQVLSLSPTLADKVAIDSSEFTIPEIADEIERAIDGVKRSISPARG